MTEIEQQIDYYLVELERALARTRAAMDRTKRFRVLPNLHAVGGPTAARTEVEAIIKISQETLLPFLQVYQILVETEDHNKFSQR